MARQPAGLAGAARRCSRSTSTTRSRPAPPTAPASSPARSGSTPASWSRSCASERHTRAGRSARRCAAAKRWGAVEGGLARRRCASAARWRAGPSAARLPGRRRGAGAPSPTEAGSAGRGHPRPRSAAAVYVPACTNRIFGPAADGPIRQGGNSARRPWSGGAGRGLGAGRAAGLDSRRTSPAAAAGCPGARRASARPTRTRRTRWSSGSGRWSGEGALPVVIDAASCTHGDRRPRRGRAQRGERRAPRQARDPRLGRLGARPPAARARGRRQGRLGHRPPDLRDPPPGPRPRACGRSPARSPRTSTSPRRRPAAASPATAASPTPS